jgi:NAD(P)-dependent dehydrogenase (short-subunit alcohol dehydrogenase family)
VSGDSVPHQHKQRQRSQAQASAHFADTGLLTHLHLIAGANLPTPFFDIPEEEMDPVLTVNLKGFMLACEIFGRHRVERE